MRTKSYLLFSNRHFFAGNRGQHCTTPNVTIPGKNPKQTKKPPGKIRTIGTLSGIQTNKNKIFVNMILSFFSSALYYLKCSILLQN